MCRKKKYDSIFAYANAWIQTGTYSIYSDLDRKQWRSDKYFYSHMRFSTCILYATVKPAFVDTFRSPPSCFAGDEYLKCGHLFELTVLLSLSQSCICICKLV